MKRFLLITLCSLSLLHGYGQSAADKAKMERERQAIQNELKQIQGVYNQVKGQKKETIGQLNLLQKKVSLQGQYVNNINKEIRIISDDIYLNSLEVSRLQRQLDTLKTQYAKSVVYAYKNRSTYDYLNFIFSSTNFNDALKRIAYLRSYRSYRQEQVNSIVQTQQKIEQHKQQLLSKKNQKNSALQNQTEQLKVLEVQKQEKDQVVAKLKSQETELQREITAKKKRDSELKKSINIIIQREIAARRKAEREERERRERAEEEERKRAIAAAKAAAPAPSTGAASNNTSVAATRPKPAAPKKVEASIPLNAKEVSLTSAFNTNKGKLPWPVDNGFVSIHYGSYEIPGTRIKGDNPGITITTPAPGSTVKSVFDGEVIGVFNMGDGMAVTISHGKYFTTYSNLTGVSVTRGSQVRTGQSIGRVGADDEGGSGGKMDFILMVETRNVNPEPWLR